MSAAIRSMDILGTSIMTEEGMMKNAMQKVNLRYRPSVHQVWALYRRSHGAGGQVGVQVDAVVGGGHYGLVVYFMECP